jgi:hypothetical protein
MLAQLEKDTSLKNKDINQLVETKDDLQKKLSEDHHRLDEYEGGGFSLNSQCESVDTSYRSRERSQSCGAP